MWIIIHREAIHEYVCNIAHHTLYMYSSPPDMISICLRYGYVLYHVKVCLDVNSHSPWGNTSIYVCNIAHHTVYSYSFPPYMISICLRYGYRLYHVKVCLDVNYSPWGNTSICMQYCPPHFVYVFLSPLYVYNLLEIRVILYHVT
jgi:hypothetical protein